MVRKFLLSPALAVASLLFALSDASAVQYTIAGGSLSGNTVDPGLVVNWQLSSNLSGTSFSLKDGESATFDFFKIWTSESDVNTDDKQQKSFLASLNFSDPFSTASLGGITFGGTTWYGVDSAKLIWTSGPAMVSVDGLTYSVSLSDAIFNAGFLSLNNGMKSGAMVQATVKQIAVPDNGSTAILLGVTLLVIALFHRRSATV